MSLCSLSSFMIFGSYFSLLICSPGRELHNSSELHHNYQPYEAYFNYHNRCWDYHRTPTVTETHTTYHNPLPQPLQAKLHRYQRNRHLPTYRSIVNIYETSLDMTFNKYSSHSLMNLRFGRLRLRSYPWKLEIGRIQQINCPSFLLLIKCSLSQPLHSLSKHVLSIRSTSGDYLRSCRQH